MKKRQNARVQGQNGRLLPTHAVSRNMTLNLSCLDGSHCTSLDILNLTHSLSLFQSREISYRVIIKTHLEANGGLGNMLVGRDENGQYLHLFKNESIAPVRWHCTLILQPVALASHTGAASCPSSSVSETSSLLIGWESSEGWLKCLGLYIYMGDPEEVLSFPLQTNAAYGHLLGEPVDEDSFSL